MNPALVAAVATVAFFSGLVACSVVGRRVGIARLARNAEGLPKGADSAESVIFALFGLLIAFTFFGAASRFEDRRDLIAEEANAIGTAYLRVDLLPADAQPEMRELFRRYLDARTATYREGDDRTATTANLARGVALQGELWTKAMIACQRAEASPQATMLLLPALNAVIDITTTREMATLNHPPPVVFLLLGGIGFVSALLMGYSTAPNPDPGWFHTLIFAAIVSLTVYVIVDLEFPRYGLIRVDAADQILIDVGKSMR